MSLRMKTVLGIACIEAVLLIILLSSIFRYMYQSNEEGLQEYTTTLASLFATATKDAVIAYDLAALESYVSEILKNEGVLYARVFDSNQQLLAKANQGGYKKTPFQQDISLADVDDHIFDTRAEIHEGGALYGIVEIGVSTDRINEAIAKVKRLGIGIALFEMFLVALFSTALGIFLTQRLRYLQSAARRVANGDLNHQLSISGRDEVADLGSSFNCMIYSLKNTEKARRKYRHELEELNKSLEDRVKRRTQQLVTKNSELERAYQDLKLAQVALLQSEKMASLGQMAAGVAHEINNPMAFIHGNLNSLGEYMDVYTKLLALYEQALSSSADSADPNQNEIIKKIEQFKEDEDFEFIHDDAREIIDDSIVGAVRITDIVQGLKSFSRIDQAEIQCVDINECITETLKIIENQIKHKCEIHRNFGDLEKLCCNPGKLNQVFMNLLLNANQAIEENGEIYIKTKMHEGAVNIYIRDTGKGIEKAHIKKLFEPFFTTKPVGEGTGLGLSISHGIIEEHGGTIDVESEIDIGTEFIISLPANRQSVNQKKTTVEVL